MLYLRQSTASQEAKLGAFLDSADGNTQETGLTITNTDIKITKGGATTEVNKNSGGATHVAGGRYSVVYDATDTDTLGNMEVDVHVSGALAVHREYIVLPAATFDALITNGLNDFDPTNDDVAVVTLVNTLTTYTNNTPQTADNDTKLTTLLNKIIGTLATGTHNPQSGDSFSRLGVGGVGLTALQGNLGQGVAQGGTSSTIQLASGETFATNELRGCVVNITLGEGKGQSRWISANIGITDTCSIVPDWITTPDATSIYEIVQGASSMQAVRNAALTEGSFDRLANNWSNFYNNENTQTTKFVEDVGGQALPGGRWSWSTATSGAPNPGRLRGNNATIASITELSIHQETANGDNLGVLISLLRDGDKIGIAFTANTDIFLIFNVTATPVLSGSVYAVTGNVDSTAGTFVNTSVNVGYVITGDESASVANRIEMDDNSVDLNAIIAAQIVINDNVLLIDTATMRGTDGANTVVPDVAGTAPTLSEIFTTQLTESYAADGVAPTLAQALMLIQQSIGDFSIAGTTITTKKLDGSTTAATYTLDDGTSPTSRTRTT